MGRLGIYGSVPLGSRPAFLAIGDQDALKLLVNGTNVIVERLTLKEDALPRTASPTITSG